MIIIYFALLFVTYMVQAIFSIFVLYLLFGKEIRIFVRKSLKLIVHVLLHGVWNPAFEGHTVTSLLLSMLENVFLNVGFTLLMFAVTDGTKFLQQPVSSVVKYVVIYLIFFYFGSLFGNMSKKWKKKD